ncbi:hypothetical protein [Kitasatospora sp. NBC_01539]|uniref:hypothetical protein n=1 Tax=Kitasatospora sp. NBC_01539 TaxID=2903577 RepID=UPI00386010B7
MTPHTPSAAEPAHPDIDAIADLAEGLTDPAAEPALRAHLAACASCADTLAALSDVQDLLGAVDTPPMPDDVARRIDTALAAARTPAAPAPEPTEAGRTAVDGHGRHAVPTTSGPGSASGPASGPAARPGPGGPGRRGRGRRRAVLAAVAGVALGLGALLVPLTARTTDGGSTADSAARPAAGAQKPDTKAGTDFDEATLADRIGQLVRSATSSPAAAGPDASTAPGAPGLQAPEGTPPGGSATAAPPCAAALTGREPGALVTAAPGSYHASPVTALVYAVPGQDASLDVYLITPDCAAPGILLHRTVPAP